MLYQILNKDNVYPFNLVWNTQI